MATKKTVTEESTDDSPSVKIAVMNNDIQHINETLARMEGKFDTAINNFVTNQQFLDQLAVTKRKNEDYDKVIETMQEDIRKLRDAYNAQKGAIEAQRRYISIGLTILGIAVAAITTYLGLRK